MSVVFFAGALAISQFNSSRDTLNRIVLEGLNNTDSQFVRQVLKHHPGDLYSPVTWHKDSIALLSLGIFARADLTREEGGIWIYRFKELPTWVLLPALNRTDKDGWTGGLQGAALNLFGESIRLEGRWTTPLQQGFLQDQEGFLQFSSKYVEDRPIQYNFVLARDDDWHPNQNWRERTWRSEYEVYYPSDQKMQIFSRGDFMQLDTSGVPGWQVPWYLGLGAGLRLEGRDQTDYPHAGYLVQSLFQDFGPSPANFQLWLQDQQFWIPLFSSWTLQTGALWRERFGAIPGEALYSTGGPNSLRSYNSDSLPQSRSEGLGQVELQWHIFPNQDFHIPYLNWDLFGGMDLVGGIEGAYTSPHAVDQGEFWPGFYGGIHLLVPGFERIRFEIAYPLRSKSGLTFQIGLYQITTTQLWVRR